ncbi:MAG: hypothetical protein ACLRM8_10000 [Alistipes sp.]
MDYSALCDTVSAIAVLDAQYRKAADVYTKVLKSDPKYDAIHREYVALQNVDDKDRKNANREQYNLMYDRLRRKTANMPRPESTAGCLACAEYCRRAFFAESLSG